MAPKKAAATAPKSKAADPVAEDAVAEEAVAEDAVAEDAVAEEAVAGRVIMDFHTYCPTCGKAHHGDKEGLPGGKGLPVGEIEQKKEKKGKDPSKNPKTVEGLTFENFRLKKGLKVILKRLIAGWTYKPKTHHKILFERFKDFLLKYETPKQDLPAPHDNDNDDDADGDDNDNDEGSHDNDNDDDDEGSHHDSASSSGDN